MRIRSALPTLLALLALASVAHAATPKPPATPVHVVRDTLHGVVIEDPYRWLEDKNSPETKAWVREQMAFTRSQLDPVPGLADVKATLAKYTKVDTRSVPTVRGERLVFTTRPADRQQGRIVMRDGADGADVVLVDGDTLSADHLTSVSIMDVSVDGNLLAYGIRRGGEDELEPHLLDLRTRRELACTLPKARFLGLAIAPDGRGCWYARWSAKGSRVLQHRFGDDAAKDRVVFGEGTGPSEIPEVGRTDDGKWILVSDYMGASGDDVRIWAIDAVKGGALIPLTGALHERVEADAADGRFVFFTTWQAPKGRIMVADARRPGSEHWTVLVPERADATIEGFSLAAGRLFVLYLRNCRSELKAFTLDGHPLADLVLPGLGSATAPAGEFSGHTAYFSYRSFTQPTLIQRFDATSGASTDWWRSPAPFDGSRFETRQITYLSKDGTKVPMFVVQPKGMTYDGTHSVLMTGYGGFNVSETPGFSPLAAAWLDLGGVYVSTNLRGGAEFGDAWHQGGMRARKQNTFDDFMAAGQWLLTHGYCTQQRLGILGGSNGGLLVGAALTQRPDLFGAVVCEVPLLDMVRFHRFLVARFWTPEYGCSEDPEQFRWLYAYSPYHHVTPGTKYPATMFVSGDSDTRVDPLHARKMAALVQAAQGGDKPILLRYDVTSGHSGGQSADKSIEDNADILQFLRSQLGMLQP